LHFRIILDYNTIMFKSNKPLLLILAIMLGLLLSPVSVLAAETTQSMPKISEIYPNAPGSSESGFEFIELQNTSTQDIDLTGYQLKIKDKNKQMILEGVLLANGFSAITTTFSLVNSGEVVQLQQLQNEAWVTIEEVSYGSGALEDQSWSYFEDGWQLAPITQDLPNVKYLAEPIDVCPITPDIDEVVPEGYVINDQGECQLEPPVLCDNQVVINEFLSDPVGLEADGGEFIELYNPGESAVSLLGCQLKTSKSSSDVITFTEADIIKSHGYYVINLVDKITNASGSITFLALGREDVVNYSALHEGEGLSLFMNGWEVTDKLTPNQANELVLLSEEEGEEIQDDGATTVPCPEGKYRNPATGRCKNIETASAELADCDPGEYRSTETNRCRKVSLATASLVACDVGQERNPTTNRCRKIQSSSDDVKPCKDGYERNEETNRCRKIASALGAASTTLNDEPSGKTKIDSRIIAVVMSLILGYGIYEYRTDITRLSSKIFAKARRKNSAD
jgi:hypothetical protein